METFSLDNSVERLLREMIRVCARDKRESAFMLRFSSVCLKAAKKRERSQRRGKHVPPFMICSLTDKCSLNCKGCYAMARSSDGGDQLSANDWLNVFNQAADLGMSFILLAGGEPLLRRDVVFSAARCQDLFFPVFTNGTLIDSEYTELFYEHRNLFPVISIEGGKSATDERRGEGIYDKVTSAMKMLSERGLLYGASVTVTKENYDEVYSEEFVGRLSDMGCKAVIYVEYVPFDGRDELAPDDELRIAMQSSIQALRKIHSEMIFISFPGDEEAMGGCQAAGRGFFHVNSCGGAEPCPFSPYSDSNVRDMSLSDVLGSKLFKELRDYGITEGRHNGGCVLFEKRGLVEHLLKD